MYSTNSCEFPPQGLGTLWILINKKDITTWVSYWAYPPNPIITTTLLQYGLLSEEAIWQYAVLILKGGGYFVGNVFTEVLCKMVAVILYHRLGGAIELHDVLHLLYSGHGVGTISLKAKLIQQLVDMMEEVLYNIFLDLHKAYADLDRYRCLKILEWYGVRPQVLCLIKQ